MTLAIGAFGGCGANAGEPAEELSRDSAAILAIANDGDVVYAIRTNGIERVDGATGQVSRVSGPEYATCPRNTSLVWPPVKELQGADPHVRASDGALYFSSEECGLWKWVVAERRGVMLLTPSVKYGEPGAWGRSQGPWWQRLALAPAPGGLVVCIRTPNDLQIWRTSLDGDPLGVVTTLPYHVPCIDVFLDAGYVYFGVPLRENVTLYRAPLEGPVQESQHISELTTRATIGPDIVHDAEYVYMTTLLEIERVRKSVPDDVRKPVVGQGEKAAKGKVPMASDRRALFWFSVDSETRHWLYRTTLSTGATELVSETINPQANVVIAGEHAYFARIFHDPRFGAHAYALSRVRSHH